MLGDGSSTERKGHVIMLSRLSLRARLLVIGITVMTVPLVIITGVVITKQNQMKAAAAEECRTLAFNDLDHIVQGIKDMCASQQAVLENFVAGGLATTRHTVAQKGAVSFSDETVSWNAVNQYTKAATQVQLPKMLVGEEWLGQNASSSTESPVVDQVQELVGGTSTIFQRMNDRGDMLRVCTNVMKQDGQRAIGTYIPAVNPDGKPNPVIQSVLSGKTFQGKAYVVDRWYVTAYEPIRGNDGDVVGINYFGIPMEQSTTMRQAIMDTKVGETGYVYVLDSKGNYVISAGGKRDGENIMGAKDSNGVPFIQEIIAKAQKLGPDQIDEQWYPWKNKGDTEARMKVARFCYFEPWDWVIGAGSYESEFMAAEQAVSSLGRANIITILITGGVTLVLSSLLWFLVASNIGRSLMRLGDDMGRASDQVSSSSSQIAASSQQMAEGASEQAASLEEIAASLQEMSSVTQETAANATSTDQETQTAASAARKGVEAMSQMSAVIGEIKNSSDETARILKTIDEIAFQTNLLALNAAVEAARAGEAGKGFAVVAEEVRNLAQRSAEAARSTATLIEASQQSADGGVKATEQVSAILEEITGSVDRVKDLVSQVASASREQAEGIGEINNAVNRLDQVTQTNAASAEESAAASKDLETQARTVQQSVIDLRVLTSGTGAVPTSMSVTDSYKPASRASKPAPAPAAPKVAAPRATAPKPASAPAPQAAPKPEPVMAGAPEDVLPLDDDDLLDL
jgi:hypothetical protein